MIATFRIGAVLVLLCLIGCSGSPAKIGDPGGQQASEVLLAHFEALHRGDWRRAYEQMHPELKSAGFSLERFTSLYDRRLKMKGAPEKIDITGSEQIGDDVIVSFDVCAAPHSGGVPVAISPRRKATLRKSGGSWSLLTHDILSVQR
jgi:hypothetical protein